MFPLWISTSNHDIFNTPYALSASQGLGIYNATNYGNIIHINSISLTNVEIISRTPTNTSYADITVESNRFVYWAFIDGVQNMTTTGEQLMVNLVTYTSGL